MYSGKRVAVVVPAYNEHPHVGEVVDTLPEVVDRAYVVDDASTDETWREIRAAVAAAPAGRTVELDDDGGPSALPPPGVTDGGRPPAAVQHISAEPPVGVCDDDSDPVVVGVRHADNQGRGAAIKTGYRMAVEEGMDLVAVMDGDGQMDPDQLERLLAPVASGRADYAKGNRLAGPEYWQEMSGWRLFGNLLLTGLTRISTGYWGLRDPQNGYTAISRETLESLPRSGLYDDYGFLNDLLGALSIAGASVSDVPLPAVYDDEDSGIRYRQFVPAVSLLLLVNFLRRLYVDGARRHRVGLPVAYGFAGVSWLGAVLAEVALALPGQTVSSLSLASMAGVAAPLLLAGTAGLATVVAVALDRRLNAVIDGSDGMVVGPR